jgi:hypothetical protein
MPAAGNAAGSLAAWRPGTSGRVAQLLFATDPRRNWRAEHARKGAYTTLGMPLRKHPDFLSARDAGAVIASRLDQDATCACDRRLAIRAADARCVTYDVKRGGQFSEETVWAARRFARHQSSISRNCASASGVVRTGSVTAAGAVRPELPTLVEAGLPQLISRMRTALRAGRGALRR